MNDWIDVTLDVLAANPAEINKIEAALLQPCNELLPWAAEIYSKHQKTAPAGAKGLVTFDAIQNLGYVNPSVNKARRFMGTFEGVVWAILWTHVYCLSRDFPEAIFLAEHWDHESSHCVKNVIRGGREIRHIHDGDQQTQGHDWTLLDIFLPYNSEYFDGKEFGVLWDSWLAAMGSAVAKLKERYGSPKEGATCQSALLECERKVERTAEFMEHDEGKVSEAKS